MNCIVHQHLQKKPSTPLAAVLLLLYCFMSITAHYSAFHNHSLHENNTHSCSPLAKESFVDSTPDTHRPHTLHTACLSCLWQSLTKNAAPVTVYKQNFPVPLCIGIAVPSAMVLDGEAHLLFDSRAPPHC